jgi:hypothetical protein
VALTVALNDVNFQAPSDFQANLAAYGEGQPSAQEMPVKVDAGGKPAASVTLPIPEEPSVLHVELRHPQDGSSFQLTIALDPSRTTARVVGVPARLPAWLQVLDPAAATVRSDTYNDVSCQCLRVLDPVGPLFKLTLAIHRAALLYQIELNQEPQTSNGWQVVVATFQDGSYRPSMTAAAVARGKTVGLEDPNLPLYVASSKERVNVQVQFLSPANGQPVSTNQGEIDFISGEFRSAVVAPTQPEVQRIRLALGAVERAVTLPVALPAEVLGTAQTQDSDKGWTGEFYRGFPTPAPSGAPATASTPVPQGPTPTPTVVPPVSPRGEPAALTLSVVQQRGLAPVAGARVALEGMAQSLVAQSDTKGQVAWADLAPGQYQFTVTKAGYQPVTQESPLASGQRPHRTVELTTTDERTNRWLLPALAGLVGVLALVLAGMVVFKRSR